MEVGVLGVVGVEGGNGVFDVVFGILMFDFSMVIFEGLLGIGGDLGSDWVVFYWVEDGWI